MVVPNELVESILKHLYLDTNALLNCALVGRAWLYPSQRGIFRQIVLSLPQPHISITDYETQMKAFLVTTEHLISSFDANPCLASYVRSLQLAFPLSVTSYRKAVYTDTTTIVQRLSNHNVDELSLHANWDYLPHSLKAPLTDMLSSPLITQLSLKIYIPTFAEVAFWLSHMPYLKFLNVQLFCHNRDLPPNSSLLEPENEVQGCPPRSIQLEQLLLRSDDALISFAAWFWRDCCPFQVQNLRLIIDFACSKVAFDMLKLQDIGPKVRELSLHSSSAGLFHLGYTPNIHSLKLELAPTHSGTSVPFIENLFTPVLNLSDPWGNRSNDKFSLRHLSIYLIILLVFEDDDPRAPEWDQWGWVDTLLAKPNFTLLETVQITVTIHRLGPAASNVMEPLNGKLPLLEASGKLNVSYIW